MGRNRKEIKEQIMSRQVYIRAGDLPEGWTTESADFINKCLQRKPAYRLGLHGFKEARDHPWFKDYPWKELYEKKLDAPFVPRKGDNFDRKYCEAPDKIGEDTRERYDELMKESNFSRVFKNFSYCNSKEVPQRAKSPVTVHSSNSTSGVVKDRKDSFRSRIKVITPEKANLSYNSKSRTNLRNSLVIDKKSLRDNSMRMAPRKLDPTKVQSSGKQVHGKHDRQDNQDKLPKIKHLDNSLRFKINSISALTSTKSMSKGKTGVRSSDMTIASARSNKGNSFIHKPKNSNLQRSSSNNTFKQIRNSGV